MTKVTFETATLADCIRKADTIAPRRGSGFDKAAGIIIQLAPGQDNEVVVMATDTDVFYMETLSCIEITGEAVTWRLPSQVLGNIIGNLPAGNSSVVTLDDSIEKHRILIKSNRTKVKINSLDSKHYPFWDAFPSDDILALDDFGATIQKVQWACSARDGSLKSVFITEDCIFATDRFKIARVKMDTPVQSPMIVPCFQLVKVLPRNGEVKVTGSGKIFVAMPDDYTQIATTTVDIPVPPVGMVLDANFKYTSQFHKTPFLAMLNRAMAFSTGDRQATVTLITGRSEIAVVVDDQEVGLFGDVCDITGDAEGHSRFKVKVGPNQLRDAVNSVAGENVTLQYNDPDKRPGMIKLSGSDETYSCAIALHKGDEKGNDDE